MSDNDKAMVECSTVGFRSLADGTVRFTVDVDPPYREVALKAFSQPGTPCVLAVLTQEVAKKEMVANEAKKATRKKLCDEAEAWMIKENSKQTPSQYAAYLCIQENYQTYSGTKDEGGAINHIREFCGVESRGEFDTDPVALNWLIRNIGLYRKFVQDNQ